jgi:putative protein-disulfide isomerase
MDPMCGWCYGFQPELEQFLEKHPSAEVDWIMGGLAPDTDQPMDESLQQTISSYWYQIEERTQVSFNHDFWALNTPYRSTYPACRAVISAERIESKSAPQMAKAIQSAYYLEVKNPSLEETLIICARSMDLDEKQFLEVFKSEETEQRFQQHLSVTRQLQIQGFPALLYVNDNNQAYPLALGYSAAASIEQQLRAVTDVL